MQPRPTRERLLDATRELLSTHGPGAITTGAVCAAVGLTQSAFYRHFDTIDQCVRTALERMTEGVRAEIRADRHLTGQQIFAGAEPLAATAGHYRRVLAIAQRTPALAPLLVRHRYSLSPTAEVLLALDLGMRQDLAEDILAGQPAVDPVRARIAAELLVGAFQGVLVAVVDGRVDDLEAAAWALAGISGRTIDHLLEFPAGASGM